MDRALRNVNDAAVGISNRESGYLDLTNVQLAQEVQKLSGYNHFSSSAANLLEEVVRRLVCSQGVPVKFADAGRNSLSLDPLDQPVAFGSTITMRDLIAARYTVKVDPRQYLKKSVFTDLGKQLNAQGLEVHFVDSYLEALKQCYNLTAICKQAPANFNIIFYWLKNGSMYWTWCAVDETQSAVNKCISGMPAPKGHLS